MKPRLSRSPIAVFALGLSMGVFATGAVDRMWLLTEEPDIAHYRRVRDFVASTFVGETNGQKMVEDALHGLARGLDEYSRYYDAVETRELERETAGRYAGMGAVFRRPWSEARVLFTLPDSPARRAGLEVGDRIARIASRPASELDEQEVRAFFGETGPSELELTVVGLDGATRSVMLRRDTLVDPTVRHERIVDAARGIGYLAITSFSHETPREFDSAFERLRERGLRALVIDLRGNPGGVLHSAVRVAQRFVAQGPIVSTEGRAERVIHRADAAEAWYRGTPLVVLVDDASASASEVLAGALQDHRCAVVVGSTTYGKGMVQTIRHFPETQAVVKLTTSSYYTPARRNLERSVDTRRRCGIEPDVAVWLSPTEQHAVHEHLARYSPPEDALPALRAWERVEDRTLIEAAPADAQLSAALALLEGYRPGPHAGGDV